MALLTSYTLLVTSISLLSWAVRCLVLIPGRLLPSVHVASVYRMAAWPSYSLAFWLGVKCQFLSVSLSHTHILVWLFLLAMHTYKHFA